MPYWYLDSLTTADIAFQASGKSIEELFLSSWDATLNVMVKDLNTIEKNTIKEITVKNSSIDLLLFDFLQELIFYKDAEQLFLRIDSLRIQKPDGQYQLSAEARGEPINQTRHELIVDVKAVTFHFFKVEQVHGEWQATVVLDV